MAFTRNVVGQLVRPDGLPWSNALIRFDLVNETYSFDEQLPATSVSGRGDVDGMFSVPLWPNELGDKASHYVCRLPSGEEFSFTLPDGTGDIELSAARIAGAPENDPQYPTLAAYVDQQIAAAMSTALTSDGAKTAGAPVADGTITVMIGGVPFKVLVTV